MKKIHALLFSLAICVAITPAAFALSAGAPPSSQPGAQAPAPHAAAPSWTIDQAVTCSVSEAWALGGRDEHGFFAIVKALAELSAQKRDITLPDNREVGRKFGLYIKTQARADRDQLLYAIVDRAVRMYGTKPTPATGG